LKTQIIKEAQYGTVESEPKFLMIPVQNLSFNTELSLFNAVIKLF